MKYLFALFSALFCFNAAAQMLPDSSVVIMTHLKKGFKCEYNMTETSYTVNGTDTTEFKTSSSILEFKVLKASKEGYTISITCKDEKTSDEYQSKLNEIYHEKFGNSVIIFSTDMYGTIVDIDNFGEIRNQQLELLEPAMALLEKKHVGSMTPGEYQQLYDDTRKLLADHNVIRQSLEKYLRLFTFHGTQMKLGEEYNGETQIESIIPGYKDPIKAFTNVYVDPEYTDEQNAVIRMSVYTEEKSMIQGVIDALIGTATALGSISSAEVENSINELSVTLDAADLNYTENTILQIHLSSGVPVVSFYDKFVDMTVEGVKLSKVKSEYIEMIFD